MTQNLQKFNPNTCPIGSLEAYIARVNQIPMLTLEEEQELSSRLYEKQDLDAAKQLVLSHLRFVVSTARGYMGYGLPLGDLIQEGNIGLMKAVKRFDPKVGVRLVSFAIHWIKAEIHEFIVRNLRIVKMVTTKAQRKLFFNLRKATKNLTRLGNKEMEEIATKLNVSKKEVAVMQERLTAYDESFGSSDTEDNSSSHPLKLAPENYLEDNRYNPARQLESKDWTDIREQKLQNAMLSLDARSQDILNRRWLSEEKSTLHELAEHYQVSPERVRQIEKMAMSRLKEVLV